MPVPTAPKLKPAPAKARAPAPSPKCPYPNPTEDITAQLRQQVVTMMQSRAAPLAQMTATYTKPKFGANAHATNVVEGRRPYDINVIMGRRKAHDADRLVPLVPLPDALIMAASASPAPTGAPLAGYNSYFSA